MTWKQFGTDDAAEAASKSYDDVVVPVGKWRALVDDIYEVKKDGEHYYCKFSGERKALMKLEVIEGPGQGGVFWQNLFIFPENSEKQATRSLSFLHNLCVSIGYTGPIKKEVFIGKITTLEVYPKKKGDGNTFRIYIPDTKKGGEGEVAESPTPVRVPVQGETEGKPPVSDEIPF